MLKETRNEFIFVVELPKGIEKKDIRIKIEKNRIEIRARMKKELKIVKKGYLALERSENALYHAFVIPSKIIIPEKAKKIFKNGKLKIVVPKKKKKLEMKK